jgi:hypothetical protein
MKYVAVVRSRWYRGQAARGTRRLTRGKQPNTLANYMTGTIFAEDVLSVWVSGVRVYSADGCENGASPHLLRGEAEGGVASAEGAEGVEADAEGEAGAGMGVGEPVGEAVRAVDERGSVTGRVPGIQVHPRPALQPPVACA